MTTFKPVNGLETKLRALLTDRNTPLWDFYTPLAASPLWVIVRHHPELDGSDLVAPPGQNPQVCTFNFPQGDYIGLYTSPGRAQQAFAQWEISKHDWVVVSAPGYQLLKLLKDSEASLCINVGVKECQYNLDPDMVEILLSRPEPKYDEPPVRKIVLEPAGGPEKHLAPLREFLGRQPKVRAAWIFGQKSDSPQPAGSKFYEFSLLMDDPEDKSLLPEVGIMVKALTPVEMEWTTAVLMADDQNLRKLVKKKPPFYARPDFLTADQR
jgi:SseB protein N-terminal domain